MYLALIESGFNPKAVSRAGAKGLWQFMRKTGKDYSLTISKTNDERTDPEKSTWAATHYFKNLMAIFGDWLLALAAYNAGEGRVIGCLKTINNPFEERSFWHIRDCLAPETRQYPPLIIAAAIIGRNPERYRFPAFSPDDGSYRKVAVAGHPEDGSMARKAGREEVVRETGRVAGMPGKEVAIPAQRGTGKRHKVLYIVQKRNTIDSISELFRVHGKDVREWNNLKTEVIRPGQKLRILTEVPYERVTYRVKRNETMSEIARAFSVRPADIVEANGLKNGWSIRTKQLLVFYRAKRRYVIRTVKKGETLSMIARSFSARTDDIIKWNNLDSHLVRPDQKLKINVSSR
jgi:membrane-bound lytic murein transglycosylase D